MAIGLNGRHERIEKRLQDRGAASVEELARELNVSTMTIRRDLDALEQRGKAIRTHGGATLGGKVLFEFDFLRRARRHTRAKEAIARAAARLVQPGNSVVMDSGTTTLALAQALKGQQHLTLITTSLPIAAALQFSPGIRLLLLGGYLRPDAPDLSGAITESNLEQLQADIAFVGADAVDLDGRLYSASAEVARMLGKICSAARAAYVVAHSSKIGRTALMRYGELRCLAGLVTDDGLPAHILRKFRRLAINVIIGKTTGRTT